MYVCTYLRDARIFQQRQGHACACVLVSIDAAEDDDDVDDGGGFMMTMVMLMLITMIFQIMLIMK